MLICYDLVALLLDGKTFAADAMVIALGITLSGEKVLLGFVQTDRDDLHPLHHTLAFRAVSPGRGRPLCQDE